MRKKQVLASISSHNRMGDSHRVFERLRDLLQLAANLRTDAPCRKMSALAASVHRTLWRESDVNPG
jgi:hypothetical protein